MEMNELTQEELNNQKQTDLFEAYYSKTMEETERLDFEQQLQSDAELLKQYELHVSVMEAIQRKGMRKDLQKIVAPKVISFHPIMKYVAAASVLLFVIGGTGFIRDGVVMQNYGVEQLVGIDVSASRGSSYETDFSLIHSSISNKDFATAQTAITELRTKLQNDADANKAETNEEIKHYNTQLFQQSTDKLDWYQTILYMDSKQTLKARRWLRKIANSESLYRNEAEYIYEELLW